MNALKPCPFCGGEATENRDISNSIYCKKCFAEIDTDCVDWNIRPIEDDLRKRIAELEALVNVSEGLYERIYEQAARIAELEEIDKLRSESISTLNQAAGVKLIADVACGSKMFWFDKENPIVEFVDKRIVENHEFYPNRYIEIKPGVVADFTNLPYADKSFKLVVFDPPHLVQAGKTSWLRMKYGSLDANWPEMLHDGFWECMRVLDNYGVLIFKWAETQIPLSKVLNAIQADPLFGHKSGKYNNTHWLCFMKINTESGEVTNDD